MLDVFSEMADQRAVASLILGPTSMAPSKFASKLHQGLHLPIKWQKLNLVLPSPCDEAPNNQILRQTIRIKLLLALQLCDRCSSSQQYHCKLQRFLCGLRMKMMAQMFPVATYLDTINLIKHAPFCTHCGQGGSQKESLSHFLSTCPKFCHARKVAHNQGSSSHHFISTRLCVAWCGAWIQTQVSDSDTAALQMSLGRWQPDFMAISYPNKKIAIGQEECRLSDTRAENLFEAHGRKLQTNNLKIHCLRMDSLGPSMGHEMS